MSEMNVDYRWDDFVEDMHQEIVHRWQHGALNSTQRTFLTIGVFAGAIANGGMASYQYLIPEYFTWGEYPQALHEFGASELAAIVAQAESVLRIPPVEQKEEQYTQMLGAMNEEYFACERRSDMMRKAYDYIHAHRDQFPVTPCGENPNNP